MESAELCEDEDEAPLYDGGGPCRTWTCKAPRLRR